MPHADMAEGVENVFVGENARRYDELVQYVGEIFRHYPLLD